VDTLRAGWLIKAIAAAQDLKPAGLGPYIDTLHLIVENFDQVRGEFPVEFLFQQQQKRFYFAKFYFITIEISFCFFLKKKELNNLTHEVRRE
jgi:hypothetical protein